MKKYVYQDFSELSGLMPKSSEDAFMQLHFYLGHLDGGFQDLRLELKVPRHDLGCYYRFIIKDVDCKLFVETTTNEWGHELTTIGRRGIEVIKGGQVVDNISTAIFYGEDKRHENYARIVSGLIYWIDFLYGQKK